MTELAILWLASTVMGEVGAHNRWVGGGRSLPPAKTTRPLVIKNIILINQYAHVH